MKASLKAIILLFFLVYYPLEGQRWTTLETSGEMEARTDHAFMSCKGKFYMIGGSGLHPVSIFDPYTGRWTLGSNPPVEMHHFQAARYGEKIYVMGALTGSYPDEKPLGYIYIYDTEKDEWSRGDPIPEDRRRGAAATVSYRGMLYLIGGTKDRHEGECTGWIDRYDPRTGKWKKLPDAPHARDHFHAGVIKGRIYAAGGRSTFIRSGEDRTIAEVDVFDIDRGRWTTLPESQNLPTKRAGCTTVALLDQLLVIGGENMEREEAFDLVEAFNVETGQWEEWDHLVQGRQGTQAFMCVGCIFIASGSSRRSGGTALASIEKLEL